MGTINYSTSDYITMAVKPYNVEDFKQDHDFMQLAQEQADECGESLDDYLNDELQRCYDADIRNIQSILDNYDFYYYHITIKPGYYEGFSLDIENNFGVAYNKWQDKQEAQKEITQIKKCLSECAGNGLVKCCPHWCTTYYNYGETCKAINEVIKEMREEVKHIPTTAQYF